MPSVYDAARAYQVAFSYRDVPAEVDALVRMSGQLPDRVLELAAGPAEHAIEFARRRAEATALDLSEAMLAQAGRNAAQAGVAIQSLLADMRVFEIARPVDLAFCMISSISHVLSLDDLIAHLSCVRRALRPGGRYIVEGSHPTEYLGARATENDWETTADGITVRLRWGDDDVIDPVTQVTPVRVTLTVTGPDGSSESTGTVEPQRFWTRDEMDAAGRLAGMRLEAQYGDFQGRPLADTRSWRMISVFRPC